MTQIPDGCKVSYQQQYRKCGNAKCKCKDGRGHGPYWYAYFWHEKRLKSQYIGKKLPEGVQA